MERLSLSNSAFEGNNNVFLFDDGPETVLVDTGDWLESTRDQLVAALDTYDVALEDIDRIFLTHWHHDHTGLAGRIQTESGATVHVHEKDAPLVRRDEDAWDELRRLQNRYFDDWGIPASAQSTLRETLMTMQQIVATPSVETFSDGDVFSFNGCELTVVHTSGHADGLCMFETTLEGDRVIFAGDALLPVYTPNVGGADVRVERPLEKYLHALQGIVAADYDRCYAGHRHPIDNPTQRAEEIITHHRERAQNVLDAIEKQQPCDSWTISAELFGSLEGIHVLHGPGESYAHLEALERQNIVTCEETEYRLTRDRTELSEQSGQEHFALEF